jgi:hypothetical protein
LVVIWDNEKTLVRPCTPIETAIYLRHEPSSAGQLTHTRRLTRAFLLAAIAIFLVESSISSVAASSQAILSNESDSLKLTVNLSEDTLRRGGSLTITVTVEDENGVVKGALVKALVTFSSGRQNSLRRTTDSNGTSKFTYKIPTVTPLEQARVDVMVRIGNDIAIQTSYFTVK